ncbi:MAG: hypothetical protein NC193_05510, partial [bacterium]|nr:hypothetical protein [bacterium]
PEALLARVEADLAAGRYPQAWLTADTITAEYPGAVEVRHKLLALLPRIKEGLLVAELTRADSLCAANELRADSLSQYFRKVDNDIEPYYAARTERPGQGITARLSPDGMLYIISTLRTPRIGHTAVGVATPGDTATVTPQVAADGERNAIIDGAETVHFVGLEAEALGRRIATDPRPMTLTFSAPGGKTHSQPLDEGQRQVVKRAWEYASTIRQGRVLHLRRKSADHQLAIARNQIAVYAAEDTAATQ